jgi:uncharacterized protein (PEP-CTERM system associated)
MERVTGVMGITPMERDDRTIRDLTDIMIYSLHSCRLWITLFGLLLCATIVEAGNWEITPRISVAEVYSDNINLDDSDKEYDLVTEITPGISLHGEGARLVADLDYQMQNTIFLKNSDGNGTFHQLNANGTAELRKDFFFMDATSTMGQAVISADDTASTGNLNNAGNRTDFITYSLSPYILPHFGNVANGNLRYRYSTVLYDSGDASDADIHDLTAGLVSGRFWGPLSWSGEFHHNEVRRDSGGDDTREGASGNARYLINNHFSLVARGGYFDDDYESSEAIENGSYWAVGFFWQPSRFYSLEALNGNNLTTVTVGLYPTQRTALLVNYEDRGVGPNTGEVWSGNFQHSTRHTSWNASYEEETTTQQEQQLQEGFVFLSIDPITGEVNPNPQPGDLTVIQPTGPIVSLTNETIERKRASGRIGMRTGKSGLLFNVFNEKRKYLSSLIEEETKGFDASWNRRLAPRTNSNLLGSWQRLTNNDLNTERDFWYIEAQLSRQIRPRLNGSVRYRFSKEEPDKDRDGYQENRIEARLTAYF